MTKPSLGIAQRQPEGGWDDKTVVGRSTTTTGGRAG